MEDRVAGLGIAHLLPSASPERLQLEGVEVFAVCCCRSLPIWIAPLRHSAQAESGCNGQKGGVNIRGCVHGVGWVRLALD